MLMYFPIQSDTIRIDLAILYFKGSQVENSIFFIYISEPEDYSLFIFANCADPDEMSPYATSLFAIVPGLKRDT